MLLDRQVAVVSIVIGALTLLAIAIFGLGGDDARFWVFCAIDMIFFSVISALFPRSNAEVKHGASEFTKFVLMAAAVLGFVVVTLYLLAGSPSPISDEMLTIAVVFGLPASLILPVVIRRLALQRQERNFSK